MKLKLKFHGIDTWRGTKVLQWEALTYGYANYGPMINLPITPGSIITISNAYFWKRSEAAEGNQP